MTRGDGRNPFLFTAVLSAVSGKDVSVDFATANFTAHDGTFDWLTFGRQDYLARTGTSPFPQAS